MKKIFLLALFSVSFLFTGSELQAQSEYQTALGVRAPWGFGLSAKHFVNDQGAIEVIVSYWGRRRFGYNYNWTRIWALYQHHTPIPEVIEGLQYYYGGGVFVGYNGGDFDLIYPDDDGGAVNLGLAANLGLDFKIPDVPLNVSVDWLPTLSVSGYRSGFYGNAGAVAVRFTLN